jgi:putative SOS response-associated peptidase YedK
MCTRYITPQQGDIERFWSLTPRSLPPWPAEAFPRYAAPFIRARRDAGEEQRELVLGQWSLVPWFAKTPKLPYATANARSEELQHKASYRQPWARGQRCLVPAWAFFEPCWESGRHVPWRFAQANGEPWGLAGLWNTWVDPASGEIVESFTLLTLNADAHPLMRRMHKPDPKRPPEAQDKRSVIPIAPEHLDLWLHAPPAQARALLQLAPVEAFDAGPA